MINRAFLVMAAACVFAFASPSYATYWNSHRGGDGYNRSGNNHNWFSSNRDRGGDRDRQRSNKRSWDCDWEIDWDRDCDDDNDRGRNRRERDRDSRCNESWFDCEDKQWDINCGWDWDWDWKDCDDKNWSWDCDWDRDWKDCGDRKPPRCDNPVPEPATAGLACMGMGALTALTRRRRK